MRKEYADAIKFFNIALEIDPFFVDAIFKL